MKTLLLEVGTEDLPARLLQPLAHALHEAVVRGLGELGVTHADARSFATPRRIAVQVEGVAATQPPQHIERHGPKLAAAFKDGEPTKAALGFARSCGVELADLLQEDGQLLLRKTTPGRPVGELLQGVFEQALKHMDTLVPKRMRWGAGEATFVRPVHWLVCLLGEAVVPLSAFGLQTGRVTFGHRFHAPAAIELAHADAYETVLRQAQVWADAVSRKAEIRQQVEAAAAALNGVARIRTALLDEVAALVEWPVVVVGRLEERFLALPPEVVVATVETNQRYFTVFSNGDARQLLPAFITIANIQSKHPAQVVQGNERVVRPRLSDAMFFWEQDKKQPLAAFAEPLAGVGFHKQLGSMADKVRRITVLAGVIAKQTGQDTELAARAAALCKNDLVTQMVFEFPELQGIMGGYYARHSGEADAVAQAITEHYLPTGHASDIPATDIGRVVALADKLDTLAGIFAAGQPPTASKDPFALRRAALGVLRICIEGTVAVDLRALLQQAVAAQPCAAAEAGLSETVLEFVMERLRAWLAEQGVTVEVFNAVQATGTAVPADFMARVAAVQAFTQLPEAANLAAAHKRVRNLLKKSAETEPTAQPINPALLQEAPEQALHTALSTLQAPLDAAMAAGEYTQALKLLAGLRSPVDAFFEQVMVMADDAALRSNRLALLGQLDAQCRVVADISCLPG